MEKGWWKYISDYTLTRDLSLIEFKNEFDDLLIYNLKISGIFAVFVMIAVGIIHKKLGKKLTDKKELISGHNYVTGKELKKLIRDKSDITLSGIPYPKGSEARHTLITGTTGSGKTNVIIELIDQVQALGERAIIVDTVGTYVEQYYNPERGDIILNPLDPRSVPWSFLEECDCDALLRNVASCLIDKGGDHDRFWEDAAKIVFVETAKKIKKDKKSLDEFIDVLLKTPLDEMQKYLSGSYGASLMDKSADKMALSIRATLINAVHIFDVLREDSDNNFSIKKWINESAGGFLFFSCSPKERSTIIPMITAWLTIASESLMETKATDKRTWFFIDELHNLRKLPMLDTALAEIRKFGGCFVMGTQLISQLNVRYGQELTRAITGLCGTKVVMNVPEPITAKYMADFLGDKEEITTTETLSYGANTIRDGANIAQRYSKESTVSGSQIMFLKTGEAFLKFHGMEIIGKVMFKYHKLKISPVIEAKKITADEFYDKYEKEEPHIIRPELCGLMLTDRILLKPLHVFATDESWQKFFDSVRETDSNLIVFETGDELRRNFCIEGVDSVIGENNGVSCSWDIFNDFKGKYDVLIEALTSDIDEVSREKSKDYLAKVLSKMEDFVLLSHPKDVLDVVIFQNGNTGLDVLEDIMRAFDLESENEKTAIFQIRAVIASANNYLKNCFNSKKTVSLNNNQKVTFCDCKNEDMQNLSKLMQIVLSKETLKLFDSSTLLTSKSVPNIILKVDENVFKESKESYILESGSLGLQGRWQNIFEPYKLEASKTRPTAIAKIYGCFEIIEIN